MTIKELKNWLNKLPSSYDNNLLGVVVNKGKTFGGTPYSEVKSIINGFDFDGTITLIRCKTELYESS